jgi:glycosyltransferase involved in cell wall biosynthesis
MFIINSLSGGGAERVMTTILDRSGRWRDAFDISLAILDEEPVAYPPPQWVTVHRLDCRFGTARSLLRLRNLVGRERPDLTLSFLTRANVANAFAMAGRQRPWIVSERANTAVQLGTGPRSLVSRSLVRWAYPRASKVIAVSQGVGEGLANGFSVPVEKIEVINNPVDVAKVLDMAAENPGLNIEPPYVIALGRLVEVKNFSLLLNAFARSQISGRLVIAGEGPLRPSLERLASELGIADRVVMPGFLKNPYPLLARADAFALTSNAEGFPNVVLEALALSVPAVATNCRSGPAEILDGKSREEVSGLHVGKAGIVTPVGDVELFAAGLRAIRLPGMRARFVEQGKQQLDNYSIENVLERYWRTIESLLGSMGSHGAMQ